MAGKRAIVRLMDGKIPVDVIQVASLKPPAGAGGCLRKKMTLLKNKERRDGFVV